MVYSPDIPNSGDALPVSCRFASQSASTVISSVNKKRYLFPSYTLVSPSSFALPPFSLGEVLEF